VARFVEREIRACLECGVLATGFLRVHCDDCGRDRLVAFSCKGRSFCPSCGGWRMAETADHLVERVLPEAPVRQWVLTLPGIGRSSCGSARLPGMDALVSPCREPATGPRGRGRALESETRRAETRDPRRAIRSSAR